MNGIEMEFIPIIAQVSDTWIWVIPTPPLLGSPKSPQAQKYIFDLLVRFFARTQVNQKIFHRPHSDSTTTPGEPYNSITECSRHTAYPRCKIKILDPFLALRDKSYKTQADEARDLANSTLQVEPRPTREKQSIFFPPNI